MKAAEVLQLPQDVYDGLAELYNRVGGIEQMLWNKAVEKGRIVSYPQDEHEAVLRQGYIKTIEVES